MDIRRLTPDDATAVLRLCGPAGWNQTDRDVRRLLALDPDGGFAAWADGRVVGTATATAYGPALGWVGMVLVDPQYRRRGIASALTESALGYLRARGVGTIKLDATPLGRPVYERLGFVPECLLERWAGQAPSSGGPPPQAVAWDDLAAADRAAFGADRGPLLRDILADPAGTVAAERDGTGRVTGYAIARPGCRAGYAGPVVADDAATAGRLLASALAGRGGPVFLDVFTDFPGGVDVLMRLGFARQRELLRMRLGPDAVVGRSPRVFAIAGPEAG